MKPDKTAVYEPHNESIRTGDGRHVRLRELHRALMAINPYNLRRITANAGIASGINDPMEAGQDEAVRDVIDLVRGMPQYCLPVIDAGLNIPATREHFEELFRDRRFGTSEAPEGSRPAPQRRPVARYADKIAAFFWDSKGSDGEFSYFISEDQRALLLRAGQRFSTSQPYDECFVIVRTMHGRFYLKWPGNARHEPAWYHDAEGRVQWFFPAEEDFEELFPGYTYEAYGLQFSVPNIGTDYRAWIDDFEQEAPSLGHEEPEIAEQASAPGRLAMLLEIIEAADLEIQTLRDLSKHFRQISNRYHPLKHLHASPDEKERINQRYLELTNAYNELKKHFD